MGRIQKIHGFLVWLGLPYMTMVACSNKYAVTGSSTTANVLPTVFFVPQKITRLAAGQDDHCLLAAHGAGLWAHASAHESLLES